MIHTLQPIKSKSQSEIYPNLSKNVFILIDKTQLFNFSYLSI